MSNFAFRLNLAFWPETKPLFWKEENPQLKQIVADLTLDKQIGYVKNSECQQRQAREHVTPGISRLGTPSLHRPLHRSLRHRLSICMMIGRLPGIKKVAATQIGYGFGRIQVLLLRES